MPDLLKLPLRAVDLATRPTRYVLGKLLDLRRSDHDQVVVAETPAAEAPPRPEPPQSAPPRPRAKPRPKATSSPKAARRAVRHEPTRGEAGRIRQQHHMSEQDAGGPGPGPTVEVAAPWDGYDAMTEDQVLDRLTGADPTVRAVVRLYESAHGGRRQILIATEEQTVEP
jgi:hypothetical protein